MTSQIADTIILNEEVFELHTYSPLEGYFQQINWRPSFKGVSTNNRCGYVARWEVFGERLFLTGLFGTYWIVPRHLIGKRPADPDSLEPPPGGVNCLRLRDLFPDQAPLVFAEWVTARLDIPTGPPLISIFGAFGSLNATYRTLDVVEGRVRAIRDWNGREWAQHFDRYWPDPELEQNVEWREVEEDHPFFNRRDADPIDPWCRYKLAQITALRRPCGQRPTE